MKKEKVRITEHGMKVIIDKSLNKYDNISLAPEKVKRAKEIVEKLDLTIIKEAQVKYGRTS